MRIGQRLPLEAYYSWVLPPNTTEISWGSSKNYFHCIPIAIEYHHNASTSESIGHTCITNYNYYDVITTVADFLMGVYLLAVACKDSELRAVFNQFALSWMQSGACAVLGVVAVASSEVSIFILTYLSLERYVMLVHPYKNCHVSLPAAALSMACLWLGGLLLAVLPLLGLAPSFYASNAVCFPLHLHHVYADGWQYSTAMFVCLNGACLVVICFCYVSIFRSIQQVSGQWSVLVFHAVWSDAT
jgi:hypothetical protein